MRLRVRSSPGGTGRMVEVEGERFVVGRADDADLEIEDTEISREHAAFSQLPDGRLTIEDLGSRNGTFVDGERISGRVTLRGGEAIKVGATTIDVEGSAKGATSLSPGGAGGVTESEAATQRLPAPEPQPPPERRPPARTPPRPRPLPPPPPQRPAAYPPQYGYPPQPPPYGYPPPPAGRRGGGGVTALIIVMILIVLVLGIGLVLAVSWGGVPETLYRLGLSEGWTEEEEDIVREELSLLVPEGDLDCAIDELQKRFTFDEIQSQSGDEDDLDAFLDAADECGIDTGL